MLPLSWDLLFLHIWNRFKLRQASKPVTRNSLIELESDIKVTKDAMKLLQLVYNAAETGQVSCTPSKEGTTYKLESPVGVNANLFTRNFSAMEVNDGQEEENDGNAVENVQAEDEEDSDEEYEE